MLDVNNFDAIRISLASPEAIRAGRTAKSPSRRRSTTARSSRSTAGSSASASSVRPRTGSATAASTSGSGTPAPSATSAALKSRAPRFAASAWATSSWPRRLRISGMSRARRAGSGLLLDISPRNLERVLYFASYLVTEVDEEAQGAAHCTRSTTSTAETDRRARGQGARTSSTNSSERLGVSSLEHQRVEQESGAQRSKSSARSDLAALEDRA